MARGFFTTYGSADTDRITTTLTSHNSTRSYHALTFRNGDGGGGYGRIFYKSAVEWFCVDGAASGKFHYRRNRSGGGSSNGQWSFTSGSTGVWQAVGVSYDDSSTANDPVCYLNGTSQTVTEDSTPAGTAATSGNPYVIGNNNTGKANYWDGMHAEFAVWNVILTAAEFAALAQGYSPLLIRPGSLVEYVPMLRENISRKLGAPTLDGTVVQPHPRVLYPNAAYSLSISAAGTVTEKTLTDGIYFSDPDPGRTAEALRRDNLFLKPSQARDQHILQRDLLFLKYATSLDQSKYALDKLLLNVTRTSIVGKSLLDNLFLNDYGIRDITAIIPDQIAFFDFYTRVMTKGIAADNVLLKDTAQRDQAALLSDKLLLNDLFARTMAIGVPADNILLNDKGYSEHLKQFLDKLFLFDPYGKAEAKSNIDQILLADFLTKIAEHTALDKLFTNDMVFRDQAMLATENLLLNDLLTLAKDHTALDKLLLRDIPLRTQESLLRDTLFLNDYGITATDKLIIDFLFLYDSVTKQETGQAPPGVTELTVTDNLFLLSRVLREQLTFAKDSILLRDEIVRDTLIVLIDRVMFRSTALRIIEQVQRDQALLRDGGIKVDAKGVAADSLLLNETQRKEQLHTQQEQLLLRDNDTRIGEKTQRDYALLNDLSILVNAKACLDSLLFTDNKYAATDKVALDNLLLDSLFERVAELLLKESITLGDTVTALRISITAQILKYARLQSNDYVGIVVRSIDYMGRRLDDVDFLGITLAHDHWRVAA